jgi:hypothetical protein
LNHGAFSHKHTTQRFGFVERSADIAAEISVRDRREDVDRNHTAVVSSTILVKDT